MNKEILEKRIERLEGQLKAKDEVIDKLVAYNRHTGYLSSDLADLEDRIQKAIEYIWSTKYEWGDLDEDNEDFDIDAYKLIDILEGENNDK